MRNKSHPFFFLISPSVVAGVMGFGSALQYKGRIPNDTIGDFNNIGHGIWEAYALGSILNKPTDYMYGTLVCFKTNAFAVQVAFPLNNNSRIQYRVMDGVGTWYPWRSVQYV